MRTLPANSAFKLIAAIDAVPAGATGQLKRLDDHHVLLTFDDERHSDFVFDVNDTDPAIRAAIVPVANTIRVRGWQKIAAVVAAAFLVGWIINPPSAISATRDMALQVVVGLFPI